MRELVMYPDDFITVRLGEEEYVIDSIGHTKILMIPLIYV